MQVPNFGSAIFLIGLSKWSPNNDFEGVWISNIYSQDEYWKGTRQFKYEERETMLMTSTVASNSYESIPSELRSRNFSSEFSGEYQGFRDYEINDRYSFSITSYDYDYNRRGKEVFFATSEPGPTKNDWQNMLQSCNYWKSTITNHKDEIVGYRSINLSENICEVVITTSGGFQFAHEYSRKVTNKQLNSCGGIDQLKKLFVTQDQAMMLGDINPQITASGIILDTQKSIGFHLDQARKANVKNRFNC